MKIYIDKEYKCYTSPAEDRREVETESFDGKCDVFIKGYRFIPFDETWERSDGVVFHGEMVSPWKPYAELDEAQREYEREKLADAENALAIILGGETV